MKRGVSILAWLLTSTCAAIVLAAGPAPKCLRLYTEDLADLARPERRQLLRAVKAYDRVAQDGVEIFLQYREIPDDGMQRLHQALQNFRYENTVPNPFASDRDLLAAIAEVDQVNPGIENLGRVIGDLGQENALGLAQAAAYDLYLGKQVGPGRAAGYRLMTPPINGVSREIDLVEGPPGTDIFVAILHENKSYAVGFDPGDIAFPVRDANGRFVYADNRLTSWAQEFDRDIVIHQPSGFQRWRTNLRPQLAGQRNEIEQFLLKQFESSIVTSRFTPAEITTMRNVFVQQLADHLLFR